MYELDKEAFGRFVAQARKARGLTQRQLAGQLHVTDKAVSKWERGLSVPDTALLIPLAEALEVTVTELLLCRRCPSTEPMAPAAVEDAVKAAIAYPDTVHRSKRAWQASRKGLSWFLAALAAGAAGLFLGRRMGCLSEVLPVMMILVAVFGGYFWLLVPVRLPDFYDENRIGFYWDYCFRMNLPRVAFNNANWPRVVAVMRAWSCLVLALLPFLHLALTRFLPVQGLDRSYPFLFLGSLFLPLYFAGRQI